MQDSQERRTYDISTNEKLASINIRLTEIQGEINLLKTQLTTASKDDTGHNAELASLKKSTTDLEKLAAELKHQYSGQETQIVKIHQDMASVRVEMREISSAVQKAGWLISAFISLGGIILPIAINYVTK